VPDKTKNTFCFQLNKDVEFSDNVSLLNTDLPYLLDRPVTCLAFAPDQPSILLTAHGPLPEDEEHNPSPEKTTILCVWKVSQPSAPNKVLVANGDVVHCNFSPHKASLVFAGFADGMICAWDLRESLSVHQEVVKEDDGDDVFRSPTFATHSAEEGHSSAVTAIKPLPEAQECN
jgi:WD40 repeat protein